MKKRENKYLTASEQCLRLVAEAQRHLEPDPTIGPAGRCRVLTHYFDSPERDCYWERVRKLRNRRKIRVRFLEAASPGGNSTALVTIKHKNGRVNAERSVTVPTRVAEQFAAGETEPLRELVGEVDRGGRMVINEVLDLIKRLGHEPTVRVRFDRETYTSTDQRLRIHFDANLACPDAPDGEGAILKPGLAVVEATSLGSVPTWLSDFLTREGLKRRPFSKYAAALEKFDPVLRRQLADAGTQAHPAEA